VPARVIPDPNRLNFSWLMTLRYNSVAGQLATILAVHWLFSIDLPLQALFAIIAVEFASNVAASVWLRRAPRVDELHLAAVMALDVLLLTGLLYLTGGPFNPFCFLYIVNIALAAVVLHAQWTWMLVALSLASFGLLFVDFRELPIKHLEPGDQAGLLQQGTWVAFGVAAAFIVHFLWRVTRALAAREHELGEAQRIAARQERLASLATMAAGAAHELATPLSTIAVVAKELERSLTKADVSADAVDDLRLIREQVARCRLILDQMGAGTGKSAELSVERIRVVELIDEATTAVRDSPTVEVDLGDAADEELEVPARALAQALRSLVTNAQDATRNGSPVALRVSVKESMVEFEIADSGVGMTPKLLERVGEPFFTTKAPGSGMGLGIFLGRAVVEKLGGRLAITSKQGVGTTVRVAIPRLGSSNAAEAASVVIPADQP